MLSVPPPSPLLAKLDPLRPSYCTTIHYCFYTAIGLLTYSAWRRARWATSLSFLYSGAPSGLAAAAKHIVHDHLLNSSNFNQESGKFAIATEKWQPRASRWADALALPHLSLTQKIAWLALPSASLSLISFFHPALGGALVGWVSGSLAFDALTVLSTRLGVERYLERRQSETS